MGQIEREGWRKWGRSRERGGGNGVDRERGVEEMG